MGFNFVNLCSCRTFQRDSIEEEHLPSLKLEVEKILNKFNRLKVGRLTLDYFCVSLSFSFHAVFCDMKRWFCVHSCRSLATAPRILAISPRQ